MGLINDLMHVLDFTADDLAANRRGVLSPRQRARLTQRAAAARTRAQGQTLAAVGLGGAAGFCSVFAGVTSFASALGDGEAGARVVAVFIGVAALVAGIIFLRGAVNTFAAQRLARHKAAPQAADMAETVAQTSGRVVYDVPLYLDRGSVDTFAVGDVTFAFDAERHSALLDAGEVVVYYLPGTHEIVAAEPLTPQTHPPPAH
jgi:hypothetical protein